MGARKELINFLDVLDDVPGFPFGADVKAADAALEVNWLMSDEAAGRFLRELVNGAREMKNFPFGDDLRAAERALQEIGL